MSSSSPYPSSRAKSPSSSSYLFYTFYQSLSFLSTSLQCVLASSAWLTQAIQAMDYNALSKHQQKRLARLKLHLLHYNTAREELSVLNPLTSAVLLPPAIPAQSHFARLMHNPQRFYSHTRMSPAEAMLLLQELNPNMQVSSNTAGGRPHALCPADELLLWIYAADGLRDDILAFFFQDIHRTTALRIGRRITEVVNTVWEDEIAWPDAEERRASYGLLSVDDKAVGVLDGTHCRIRVPIDAEAEYFSGYKNYHTQNYLIVVNALGFVIFAEGPYPGRRNDRGVFSTSALVRNEAEMFGEGEKVLADGGFAGAGALLYPFTSTQLASAGGEEERQRMEEYNAELTENRSLVEHCIHVVKHRAQALVNRFHRHRRNQTGLFFAACRLCNRLRRLRLARALQLNPVDGS